MPSVTPTGYVRTIQRAGGAVYYAKLKLPDGTQPQRRLGYVWTKCSRPPDGYLTKGMAETRLQAMLKGEDSTLNVAPTNVTFRQACDEHLRHLEHDKRRKTSYLKDCRSTINRSLVPLLGESTPVEEIATADVDKLREALLARGLAHRTAQKALILLGGILGRAKRKGWITTNPADNAERVSVRHSDEFNVLSIEQVHAVARAAEQEVIAAMITVAAFTGLRQGELLALRWQHVDFANRILHVRRNLPGGTDQEDTPKSHRVRSVPLSDQAVVVLDALSRREHFTGPRDLVFGNLVGEHYSDDVARDAFYEALAAAELGYLREKDDPIVFHDLRHTFGTTCAAKGIDLLKIKAWMGHADLKTTQRYLHHIPQHDDAARLTAAFATDTVHPAVHRTPVIAT